MQPIHLQANQPERFYRGGASIARLRNEPSRGEFLPEDWLAATNPTYGSDTEALTPLGDGTLRAAITESPELFLSPAHRKRFGHDPALLVKLLDAGERLPVHIHPNQSFTRNHLDCPYGKSEAWFVIDTATPEATVHLAFAEDVGTQQLRSWVEGQDSGALLGAMNELSVSPGDTFFVPAGLPHAIGAGVFLVELQEPTDFSVMLEWEGFNFDGERDGHLGLGFDTALQAVDRQGYSPEQLKGLRTRVPDAPAGVSVLLPYEAAAFFRAELISGAEPVTVDADFQVLIGLRGEGLLSTSEGGDVPITAGTTLLVPYASGTVTISGDVQLIRARPPEPRWSPETA